MRVKYEQASQEIYVIFILYKFMQLACINNTHTEKHGFTILKIYGGTYHYSFLGVISFLRCQHQHLICFYIKKYELHIHTKI